MPYTITERGVNDDAYIEGDLMEAITKALRDEGLPSTIIITEVSVGVSANLNDDYWGSGPTIEQALRFLIGAVLDPREGR